MEREVGRWRRWMVNGVVFGLGGVLGVLVVNNLRSMDGVDRVDQVEGAGRPPKTHGCAVAERAAVPQSGGDGMDLVDRANTVDVMDGVGWVDSPGYVGLLEPGEAPLEAGFYGRVDIVGVALVDGCVEVERRGYGLKDTYLVIGGEKARLAWKTVYGSHEGEVVCLGHVVGEWREEQRIPERVVWPGEGDFATEEDRDD